MRGLEVRPLLYGDCQSKELGGGRCDKDAAAAHRAERSEKKLNRKAEIASCLVERVYSYCSAYRDNFVSNVYTSKMIRNT